MPPLPSPIDERERKDIFKIVKNFPYNIVSGSHEIKRKKDCPSNDDDVLVLLLDVLVSFFPPSPYTLSNITLSIHFLIFTLTYVI